jgi:transposase-like protein
VLPVIKTGVFRGDFEQMSQKKKAATGLQLSASARITADCADRPTRRSISYPRALAHRLLAMAIQKYQAAAPKLAAWLEGNVPEGLTVFDFPAEHRRRLRTNNTLERLNREIKRRTRVATLIPNEASLLRLATAVLMETDEERQTEKRYLPKKNQ